MMPRRRDLRPETASNRLEKARRRQNAPLLERRRRFPIAQFADASQARGGGQRIKRLRQGAAGADPTDQFEQARADLLGRLQAEGGGALAQSPRDRKLADAFRARLDAERTSAGKAKAGGRLAKAEAAAQAARELRGAAAEVLQRRADAIREYQAAEADLAELVDTEAEIEDRRKGHEERKSRLTSVEALIRDLAPRVSEAERKYEMLRGQRDAMAELAKSAERFVEERRDALEQIARLEKRRDDLREQLKIEEKAFRDARGAATAARQVEQAAQVGVEFARLHASVGSLEQRHKSLAEAHDNLKTARAELAALPALDDEAMAHLRGLQRDLERAEATLAAMAVGIEVEAVGKTPPTLDGTKLVAGEHRRISETATLTVGQSIVHIRPGGGNALDEARTALDDARADLQTALGGHALTDVAGAERAFTNRLKAISRIDQIEAGVDVEAAERVEQELKESRRRLEVLRGELERFRAQGIEGARAFDDLDMAQANLAAKQQDNKRCGAVADEAEDKRDVVQAELNKVAGEIDAAREADEEGRQKQFAVEAKLDAIREQYGDGAALAEALGDAERQLEDVQEKTRALDAQLAEIDPDAVGDEGALLDKVVANRAQRKRDAELKRAGAAAVLRYEGATDPEAALSEAEAELARAEAALSRETTRVEALAKVAALYGELQAEHEAALGRPLVERINHYLSDLFGAGVRATLAAREEGLSELRLVRSDGTTFDFSVLSGGMREQLSAAVRLAAAEVLAAAQPDAALPVVFDDAFTNTDPARLGALPKMLHRAVRAGLQVVVLTCNSRDYAALGEDRKEALAEVAG